MYRYSKTRYPDDHIPPTEEQALEFYKFALEVEERIKEEIGAKAIYLSEFSH
jgi:hypothetical protein